MGSINLSQPRLVDSRYGDPSFLLASLRLWLKQRDHPLLEIQLKHTSVLMLFIYHPDITFDLLILLDNPVFVCLFFCKMNCNELIQTLLSYVISSWAEHHITWPLCLLTLRLLYHFVFKSCSGHKFMLVQVNQCWAL